MGSHIYRHMPGVISRAKTRNVSLTLLPLLQAFESCVQLYDARANFEEFRIPMCVVPATISNNVPGTDYSLGADTSLNAIVEVRLPIF